MYTMKIDQKLSQNKKQIFRIWDRSMKIRHYAYKCFGLLSKKSYNNY